MTIYGLAHISGITGVITWTNLGSHAAAVPTSMERTHNWDTLSTVNDAVTGEVKGMTIARERYEGSVEFIAASDGTGGNNTKANAAGALATPAPFAVITITDARDSSLNGKYNYTGGWAVTYTPEGVAKVKCSMRRYTASGSDPDTLAAAAS